ncbi:MAG TPA: OmpA family protein [Membranihabitans sp.]|nr:OmpA family protein [Membranihabitans sp.]
MTRILYPFFIGFFIAAFGATITAQTMNNSTAAADDPNSSSTITTQWNNGDFPYPPRPKDMWELGVDLGHSFVSGDVETNLLSGFGAGLHLRKSINYVLSLRLGVSYLTAQGLDARPQDMSAIRREKIFRQNNLGGRFGNISQLHKNYKTNIWGGSVEAVFNLGNILFHSPAPKWSLNVAAGVGLNSPSTSVNFFNGNSNYNWASVTEGVDLTTTDGRKEARSRLRDMLDDSWETEAGVNNNIRALGDEKTIYPFFSGGLGVTRKLNNRLNIGLEHKVIFSDNDLIDGFEYRNAIDKSTSVDIVHFTSLSLNFNLGSFDKRTQPLYWVNPMAPVLIDLAEVKSRPVLDLTDTDGDGVIDMLDQEPDTPEGAPVDVRGVALDSDQDGIPDYMDKEPFSRPGFDVDADGVAIMPDQGYLTEDEVNALVNNKISNLRMDWWLPMVHFDLNKYYVKPAYYGALMQIATVMQNQPDLKVVVRGHTDNRGNPDYNRVLSYNRAKAVIDYLVERYGIAEERFIIQYGGEEKELVPNLPDNYSLEMREEMQQYLNRRVEFFVARPGDEPMPRPEGPEAGEGTPGSAIDGPKYSGNKNSGY